MWEQKLKEEYLKILGGFVSLKGEILTSDEMLPLYGKIKNMKINYKKKKFRAIPYYLWANREKGKMNIWFLKK